MSRLDILIKLAEESKKKKWAKRIGIGAGIGAGLLGGYALMGRKNLSGVTKSMKQVATETKQTASQVAKKQSLGKKMQNKTKEELGEFLGHSSTVDKALNELRHFRQG